MSPSAKNEPLPLCNAEWRSRWLVTAEWDHLHRISTIKWEDDSHKVEGFGRSVCGIEGQFTMPGIFSRMGLARCKKCCEALDIPPGEGAPFNQQPEESWNNA